MPHPPPPENPPTTARLRLADHVRACRTDGQVILLDLRRNRYLAASGHPALSGCVSGWPAPGDGAESGGDSTPAAEQVRRLTALLLAQGLLTLAPGSGPPASTVLPVPARSINGDDEAPEAAIGWRRFSQFWRCACLAALRLRVLPLGSVADGVSRRRRSAHHLSHRAPDAAVRAAVAAYQRLRLFAFTAHDRCLHDALTLVGFLATQGIAAHWVIGVRTRPFGAHAWAQIGDAVLNDQHEQVRRYTPILVA